MSVTILKVLLPWITAFACGLVITPFVNAQLHKYKCWKKRGGNEQGIGDNKGTPIFNELHKDTEGEHVNTPRMGGLVIIFSVPITTSVFWLISYAASGGPSGTFDFLSRNQTWLLLAAFLFGSGVGFVEDVFQVRTVGRFRGGLPFMYRLVPMLAFGLFASWWFVFKLDITEILVPIYGHWDIGLWFIPFFVLVHISILATSVIDGIDGLSGGVLAIVFSALGVIAYFGGHINVAAFCFVLVGAVLAFLWFNLPPAKFYLGEAGYTALASTMTILVFFTDTVLFLPLIAIMLFVTLSTNVLQVLSKKFLGRKIFPVAPIHHSFEYIGWKRETIVMRYWLLSLIGAVLGTMLFFVL